MTKAPRRPVIAPDGGGALRALPRQPNGQFAKWKTEPAEPEPETLEPDPPADELTPPDAAPARPKRAATPAQLVARVTRAIERELAQIEDIVGGARVSASKRTEAEKRARTLASLARTLSEVTRLRSAEKEAKPDHDDAVPRDLDEFRRTLERRLAQMVDPPEVVSDRENDAP